MVLREITYLSVIVRITAAFLMGGILGWEREMKSRAAGLRTYMLVCVGSCMIMLTNQYAFVLYGTGDPVRMGAQVVSGIGFLGAGTIMVTKRNQIKGLTTAAGLWAVAAVGLTLGIGFYEAAVAGGVMIFLTLTVVHNLDSRIRRRVRQLALYVEVDSRIGIGKIANGIRDLGAEINSVERDREYSLDSGVRALMIKVKRPEKMSREELLSRLAELEGMLYLEELH